MKHQILFSASFYKIIEEDQRRDENKFFNKLNDNHKLTETEINDIDVKSQLEHRIQIHEIKENCWIFDKINSMKVGFYKTGKLNVSNYFKKSCKIKRYLK